MKRPFALLLTVLSVLASLFAFSASSGNEKNLAENKKYAQELESNLSKIQASLDAVQANINKARKEQKDQLYIKSQLDQQITLKEEKIATIEKLVEEFGCLIAQRNGEISQIDADIQDTYHILKEKLISSHEDGNTDVIAFILGSENFSDFLTRFDITSELFEYDRRMIDNLKNNRASVEQKRQEVENAKENCEAQKIALVQEKESLNQKYEEADNYLSRLENDEAEYLRKYKASQAEMDAVENEMKEILARIKDQERTNYSSGIFGFPLNISDYTYTSSYFGWRVWNNGRTTDFHRGVDFPAPKGTPILASNSGTVIISKQSSSYGYYIVIDHGGGVTTLYAHCSKLLAKVDQEVKTGDVIAYVGSTGDSTGNHLHFAVFVDGEAVDPLNYIKLPK